MPYRTHILPLLRRQIASWQLPDGVLVEVYLRLGESLPQNPTQHLKRENQPFDGMSYRFSMIEPRNRLCEHHFIFHVFYGQDEETLLLVRGAYVKTIGA